MPVEPIKTCPECGVQLPHGTVAGQCPNCLLGLGLRAGEERRAQPGAEIRARESEVGPQPTEDGGPKLDGEASPACEIANRQSSIANQQSFIANQLGDYELVEEVGRGGMGVVYQARQKSLDRIVALKLLIFGPQASPESVKRFRAEAVATAALQHPNIVAIHEVGFCAGQHFLVMDFVEGPSLARLIGHRPLPAKQAAAYVKTIATAIHYAHERGILHRDLKPSNILIAAQDQPRVTDFGLARRLEGDSELTVTGQVLGSPHYMPPEQATGKRGKVSRRTDVYALGAILYHALTGRPPFVGEGLAETVQQVLSVEPVSLRVLNPGVPADLETVCLKCLEKEPDKRYATAQALAEELARFLEGKPVLARPVGRVGKMWRWGRRQPARAGLIAALVLVFALGLVGVLWQWQRAERNARQQTREYQRAEAAISQLEIQRAEDLFAAGSTAEALASLARVIRLNPSNRVAAARLMSALSHRSLALPLPPLRHDSEVVATAFSPDSQRVATACADGSVRLWDARTGVPLTGPFKHQGRVKTVAFSPDGLWLLTASSDSTARLWDARTGLPVTPPLQHTGEVNSAEFSRDSQFVVTASQDKSVRVWDVRTGRPLGQPLTNKFGVFQAQFSPDGRLIVVTGGGLWDWRDNKLVVQELKHPWVVLHARFSSDGKSIVTACGDGTARVWNAATGQPVTEPLRHTPAQPVLNAEFSPDSQTVLTVSSDKTARLWDAHTGQPLTQPMLHDEGLTSGHFSPDGQFVITAADDATACLWDARTGQLLLPPLRHEALINSAGFSPDARWVVTGSRDQTARLWQIRHGQPLSVILKHDKDVRFARFNAQGTRVVTASWDATARVWDPCTGQPLTPPLRHREHVTHAEFSPDGEWVVTSSNDDTIRIWDAGSGMPRTAPLTDKSENIYDVQFSPDGRLVAAATRNGVALLWEVQAAKRFGPPLWHNDLVASVRFSPDGQKVLTSSIDGTARVFDTQTGQPLVGPLRHSSAVTSARFSPDGCSILTASRDATARMWDALTGQPITAPLKHDSYVIQAEFSPDGRLVATASADHTARIWDARTGECLTEPLRHDALIQSAQFSPDGRRLVTASADHTARVWDVQTGQALNEPLRHEDELWWAQFSPDGRWVVTASKDGTARIWEVSPVLAPAPSWLPELAEAVAGQRLNLRRISERVASDEFLRLAQRLEQAGPEDPYTRWARWFLQDPSARSISPSASLTVADYARRRADENTLEGLRDAWRLYPTNATLPARLALRIMVSNPTNDVRLCAHAEWLSRRAEELAPQDAEVLRIRAQVSAQLGVRHQP